MEEMLRGCARESVPIRVSENHGLSDRMSSFGWRHCSRSRGVKSEVAPSGFFVFTSFYHEVQEDSRNHRIMLLIMPDIIMPLGRYDYAAFTQLYVTLLIYMLMVTNRNPSREIRKVNP